MLQSIKTRFQQQKIISFNNKKDKVYLRQMCCMRPCIIPHKQHEQQRVLKKLVCYIFKHFVIT